ncbi:hypothetical protein ONE63_000556 [Megalurothrips usitatus]|uniref:Uncharacterized protein n=1 Tax=Megalurothrips usitatus TaxID=439358 RepID=A0AAV7Y2M1_9NEOP|nr:hypothetical protein ONE63_000556 [Megalurothrips usitatus]
MRGDLLSNHCHIVLHIVVLAFQDDFSAQVKAVGEVGADLTALLKQQWSAKLAQQKKNLTSAQSSLSKKIPAQGAAALDGLNKVEAKIVANLTVFVKQQSEQASQIVKDYDSLLKARLFCQTSASTEEAAIHNIRNKSQSIVNSWVPELSQIHQDAHEVFESTVRQIANTTASKISDHLVADQTRVAVTEAGVQLLNILVQEQNDDTALLTNKQIGLFNDYLQKAETVLIKLLVAAKSKSSQSAPTKKSAE